MTPEWVADAVFYQIFPDRFDSSTSVRKPRNLEPWDAPPTPHGFKGGDLEGVRRRLGYLQDLGVTAIYFTPVFTSTANHRYHTFDYYEIDPILGGDEAFRRLLDDAHGRGMRVVLDGVFNHASRGFFQFNHTLENGAQSPYVDWFHFNSEWLAQGKPLNAYDAMPQLSHGPKVEGALSRLGYRAWWDLAALPKLNFDCPDVRAFILDVAEHWIRRGVDGWRLDVPNEIRDDFWPEFRARVKAANPDAYIVGEIWDDASQWLGGDKFDAVMNYLFGKAVLGFCAGESLNVAEVRRCGGYHDVAAHGAGAFRAHVDKLLGLYPAEATKAQLNLIGSHDTPRLLTVAGGDTSAVRLAYFLLFTFPGAPCVYYGDEIGLEGGHDPACRAGFPWDESGWSRDLHGHVKNLARVRREVPALRRGTYRSLHGADGVYVFERRLGDQVAVGAVNTATDVRKLEVATSKGRLRLALGARSTHLEIM